MADQNNIGTISEEVRRYCLINYLQPAQSRGDYTFSINSGDVHRALNYTNRYPLICSAIGAEIFERENNISRVSIIGPVNSSRTIFTFLINNN